MDNQFKVSQEQIDAIADAYGNYADSLEGGHILPGKMTEAILKSLHRNFNISKSTGRRDLDEKNKLAEFERISGYDFGGTTVHLGNKIQKRLIGQKLVLWAQNGFLDMDLHFITDDVWAYDNFSDFFKLYSWACRFYNHEQKFSESELHEFMSKKLTVDNSFF